MRAVIRTIVLVVLSASLMLAAAAPALAARRLSYRGETSQGNRVFLEVLRKSDGRRFVTDFSFIARITCEDASTQKVGFGLSERHRLDENGQVTIEAREDGFFGYSVTITATVRRSVAEGTVEIIASGLTSDDQAQLCGTGVQDWSADRIRRAGPAEHVEHGLVKLAA
jgi:hypothetical protein